MKSWWFGVYHHLPNYGWIVSVDWLWLQDVDKMHTLYKNQLAKGIYTRRINTLKE